MAPARITKLLTLLFTLFTLALAAPKPPIWDGLGPKPKDDINLPPGQPTGSCEVKDKLIFESLILRGSNWNVTKKELKHALNEAGSMTAFKFWEESANGVQNFKASFNMPTAREEAVTEKVAKLVKPFRMEIECKHKHNARGSFTANAAIDMPPKEEEETEELDF